MRGHFFYIRSLQVLHSSGFSKWILVAKKKVSVELHELLGGVGHGYRLNSCAPNTGYGDKQGAQ